MVSNRRGLNSMELSTASESTMAMKTEADSMADDRFDHDQ